MDAQRTGPRWWIAYLYFQDGSIGGKLLIGAAGMDEDGDVFCARLVSRKRLDRIARFASWDDFPEEAERFVSGMVGESHESLKRMLASTGNAMSMLAVGAILPSIAGGDRAEHIGTILNRPGL